MKRSLLFSLIFALTFSFTIPASADEHDDVSGHYFEWDMRQLIDQGILNGYEDGTYKPDREVTRAEFTVFIVNSLNLSLNDSNVQSFSDVGENSWYYETVSIASSHNLVNGYDDGSFKPNAKISREEMSVMIMNALTFSGVDADNAELTFDDVGQIQSWSKPSIEKLVTLDVVAGKSSGDEVNFAPNDNTTRGEASALLNRMLGLVDVPDDSDDGAKDPDAEYTTSSYDISFSNMINIQMNKTPKVDGAGIFIASQLVVEYYANPENFDQDSSEFYQFLVLSGQSGLSADEINNDILDGKGILDGEAQAFIDASKEYNVNEIYLIAHAFHETGNGTSTLAKGVGVDENGEVPMEENDDGEEEPVIIRDLDDERIDHIVYNMYGYGAVDSQPIRGGAKYAFDQGWFSPAEAIEGGAEHISRNYIGIGQDTLYKMRWDPEDPGDHQYATHTQWATVQAEEIHDMFTEYDLTDSYAMQFDVPEFEDMPGETSLPPIEERYAVLDTYNGVMMESTAEPHLNMRSYPNTWANNEVGEIPAGAPVEVVGYNGGWYKVDYDGTTGWASGEFLEFAVPLKVDVGEGYTLNVRSAPSTNADDLGSLQNGEVVPGISDKGDQPAMDGDWYLITYKGETAYVHSDYVIDVKAEEVEDTEEE
ncbi:S-layer homology domain-containing protein [Tenuibacillus multivorans]|uniref:Beta-N-acetylglucosaminidase n=1 Tax=Tenuibacillus multivorans TaxID=237069 RepID=A0A1G9X7V0_9BACI|nr:S-layer homology domain-containing protein [Tenuibacillus multivorans]GEL78658.1 hypothetical protein TMU01_28930 [Tenuibacillus multivorans]SDM92415.1 Beta-N-acetylglucosaminidase [Tenuibacillus multivorans]